MDNNLNKYTVPIWLSNWTFKDAKGYKYLIENVVVKGKNKGNIFLDENIISKVIRKLIGNQKKHTLKATNLILKSQHGFGVEE
jgi:hypothetical protein|tara:strand:+ start:755 stop:1003 length:249 start_codon:yes stop_codon:yes gene_type:complete